MTPDVAVVTELLADQVPALAGRPVRASDQQGSSNWVFRVGDDLAVRLPREEGYVADLLSEARWLPRLAPHLGVPVPDVVHLGEACDAFPWPWAVVTWVPGATVDEVGEAQQLRLARELGEFAARLHAIDPTGQPAGSDHWSYRTGEPVTEQSDDWVDECADELADLFDPAAVREAWRRLREVGPASMPPTWVHTDLALENIVVTSEGGLGGVLDFGGLGVGDRSVDLLYAWSMFGAPAREVLRAAAGFDDNTWLRARAWAYGGPGLVTLTGYRDTMPGRTAKLTRMVEAVAAEVGVALR